MGAARVTVRGKDPQPDAHLSVARVRDLYPGQVRVYLSC